MHKYIFFTESHWLKGEIIVFYLNPILVELTMGAIVLHKIEVFDHFIKCNSNYYFCFWSRLLSTFQGWLIRLKLRKLRFLCKQNYCRSNILSKIVIWVIIQPLGILILNFDPAMIPQWFLAAIIFLLLLLRYYFHLYLNHFHSPKFLHYYHLDLLHYISNGEIVFLGH